MIKLLGKYREELLKTVHALRTVEVKGEHWLTMIAAVNSIMMVASRLQEEIEKKAGEDNAVNDTT